ncbi:MAG: endonuclease III domain-containing protein [Thermodesulfobacteriota bacterium]|nr:endonuclease III domain-containing protein [Thermodesulfobacteriota bacterium]
MSNAFFEVQPFNKVMMKMRQQLCWIYESLYDYFGELHWWPGDSPFEIVVGAILTQNTNWRNVETAIKKLKAADLLDPLRLYLAEDSMVAEHIRSSGYYNIKTRRLKIFLSFLHQEYAGNLDEMFCEEQWLLRRKLLNIKGIGEETADSILLYAGNKPVFVVDAYTRRILERQGLISPDWSYKEIQTLFMGSLPQHVALYNQFHALFVHTGKNFCRKKAPICRDCPLRHRCYLETGSNC